MTGPGSRRPRVLTVALAATVAAGCGSTVAGTGVSGASAGLAGPVSAAASGSGGGLATPGTATAAAGGGAGGSGGSGAAPSVAAAGAAGVPPGAAEGTGRAAGAPAPTVPVGPGVGPTTVNVGIIYTDQQGDTGTQYGAKGLVRGDLLAEQKAVIGYINAHGGVAGGRRLVPVAYDATSSASAQSVCTYWTQDHKVFAGVYPGGQVPSDVGAACMAKAHALWISAPFVPGDQAYMNRFAPYYYTPGSLESVRMGRDYVDGLAASGFFAPGHRVGLLYYDVPALQHALHAGVEPALTAHGVRLAVPPYAITFASDDSQDAAAVSAVQSAELKFAQAGVDRVMFLDAGAGLAFFFMQNASAQRYHPRYGLETGSNPSFIEQQSFAADQLPGSVGVGWKPADDVAVSDIPDSPARRLCRQIMAAAGQTATAESDLLIQYDMCSAFLFLRDAVNAAGAPNAQAMRSALGALRDVPDASADSMGDGYSPTKQWGAQYYQRLQFLTGCECFRYVAGRAPV